MHPVSQFIVIVTFYNWSTETRELVILYYIGVFPVLHRYTKAIFTKIVDMDMVSTHGQMEASFVGHFTWTKKRAMVLLLLQMVTDLRWVYRSLHGECYFTIILQCPLIQLVLMLAVAAVFSRDFYFYNLTRYSSVTCHYNHYNHLSFTSGCRSPSNASMQLFIERHSFCTTFGPLDIPHLFLDFFCF